MKELFTESLFWIKWFNNEEKERCILIKWKLERYMTLSFASNVTNFTGRTSGAPFHYSYSDGKESAHNSLRFGLASHRSENAEKQWYML